MKDARKLITSVSWDVRSWARAIAAATGEGVLPVRCVLVPNQRVAHSLRRELIQIGRPDGLAGTLFVPIYATALAVLNRAQTTFTPGEDALRRMRLVAVFRRELPLSYFHLEDLLWGWEDAFARTIGDLEAAGLGSSDLRTMVGGFGICA